MIPLLRKCAKKELSDGVIKNLLEGIQFSKDILSRVVGHNHDERLLRKLLLKLETNSPMSAEKARTDTLSHEVFDYLAGSRERIFLKPPIRGSGPAAPEYPRESLFNIEEYQNDSTKPSIGSMVFFDSNKCNVVGFCLPPYACIPLHDHPGMVVHMKVVFGDVWLTSFDPSEPITEMRNIHASSCKAVTCVHNSVLTSCSRVISIDPPEKGGSYHHVVAGKNGGIFLDIMAPPYGEPPLFSECTYYTVNPNHNEKSLCHGSKYYLSPVKKDIHVPMHALPIRSPLHW